MCNVPNMILDTTIKIKIKIYMQVYHYIISVFSHLCQDDNLLLMETKIFIVFLLNDFTLFKLQ